MTELKLTITEWLITNKIKEHRDAMSWLIWPGPDLLLIISDKVGK